MAMDAVEVVRVEHSAQMDHAPVVAGRPNAEAPDRPATHHLQTGCEV